MLTATTPTRTISLRLLREGRTVEDAVRENRSLVESPTTIGRLFSEQSVGTRPTWLDLVNQFVAGTPLHLENKSCAAILFLHVPSGGSPQRTFAIAFGGGHLALHADAFERNFGLKVALNSISRSNLKNIDLATLDATTFKKRVQASRKSDLGSFGFDTEQDLLRLAGGMPTDSTFASSLAGRDALTLTAKLSSATIEEKCLKALELFDAKDYQTDYSFIDQIRLVRESDIAAALDDIVFAEIRRLLAGVSSDLHLTTPDVIDPEASHEIGYFGLGFRPGSKTGYGELAIEDYVAELSAGKPKELKDISDVKSSHEIRVVVDGQGQKDRRQRLFDCFVFEAVHQGQTYVLFAGEWYCIDKSFYNGVEADFQKLLSTSPFIAKTPSRNEQELIAELDANPDLLNLDKVKTSPAGAAGGQSRTLRLPLAKEGVHPSQGWARFRTNQSFMESGSGRL